MFLCSQIFQISLGLLSFWSQNLPNLGPKFCTFERSIRRYVRQFAEIYIMEFLKVVFLGNPKPKLEMFQLCELYELNSSGTLWS